MSNVFHTSEEHHLGFQPQDMHETLYNLLEQLQIHDIRVQQDAKTEVVDFFGRTQCRLRQQDFTITGTRVPT
jgi:hypothetical protein